MKKKSKKIGIGLIVIGMISVLTSGGLWLFNSMEDNGAADFSENTAQAIFEQIDVGTPEYVAMQPLLNPDALEEDGLRYVIIDGVAYIGVLDIPSLSISLPVNASWSYPALKNTPCRFSGTIRGNDLVIAAHAYESHFAPIQNLPMGDLVVLTDVDGIEHIYQVAKTEVVRPSETAHVMHSDYDLTLFTCTYGGQSRVVVRCIRVIENIIEAE